MNWTALAAISETIGASGVIVSLLYLAVQVRRNTKWAKAAMRQSVAEGAQRLASDIVEIADIARIMWQSLNGSEIQPYEKFRIQARCLRDLRFFDNAYYQYREGLLTEDEWNGFRANLKLVLQGSIYREYWEGFQAIFAAPFRDEVNALLLSEQPINLREALGSNVSSRNGPTAQPPNMPLQPSSGS